MIKLFLKLNTYLFSQAFSHTPNYH